MSNSEANEKLSEKNNLGVILPEVLADDEILPTTKPVRRTVRKNVTATRVEKFVEEFPQDQHADDDADELSDEWTDEHANRASLEDLPHELSDVEILLSQVGNDDEYTMRIDLLTDYDEDGRTDARTARQFCFTIAPPTLDYLDKIARRFGGGAYSITLFQKSVGMRKRWTEHIATAAAPADAPAAPAVTVDPIRAKIESLFVTRLNRLLEEPPAPVAALPPANPLDQVQSSIQMVQSIAGMLQQFQPAPVASAGDGMLQGLASVFNSLGLKELVVPVVQAAIPLVMARMMQPTAAAEAQTAQSAPPGAQPARGQHMRLVSPPGQPATASPSSPVSAATSATASATSATAPGDGDGEDDLQTVVVDMLEDCMKGEPVDSAAKDFLELLEDGEHAETVHHFLTIPAGELLGSLLVNHPLREQIVSNAGYVSWLETLQSKVKAMQRERGEVSAK